MLGHDVFSKKGLTILKMTFTRVAPSGNKTDANDVDVDADVDSDVEFDVRMTFHNLR